MSDWSFYDRGLSLFPLTPRTKSPALDWGPFQHQRASVEQVAAWRQHNWNTGVATGQVSGVIVFDCDNLMARIEAERHGIPDTLTVCTPRGTHFYFNHPGWEVKNRAGRGWTVELDGVGVDGWDLRGDGGYVVGPGSYYVPSVEDAAKGKVEGAYSIERDVPVADAPDWLLALTFPKVHKPSVPPKVADKTSEYGRAALNGEMAVLMAATTGGINEQINLSAFAIGQLVAGGEITSEEGWGALQEALAVLGVGDEEKAQGTVERGWIAGMQLPRAVEHTQAVSPEQALGERAPVAPPPPGMAPAPPPPIVDTINRQRFGPGDIPQFVGGSNGHDYFDGCTYIANRDEIFTPMGVRMSKSAFDAVYGGPEFILDYEGSKKVRSAWQFFRENSVAPMPKAWDICFRPELAPGQIIGIEGLPFLNTYVPLITPRVEGDASPFVDHVRKLLPYGRDAELLLHWMASAVQNPGAKFQWWPVVQGTKGNGKSLLLRVMYNAIGERYSHQVRADSVIKTGNQFNDWVVGKLFLGFEEIRSSEGRRDFVEIMKDTVTAERLATEGKGQSQTTSDNRANGLMLTNHDDACPIDDDERRWGIFFCAQQSDDDMARDGLTAPYFEAIYKWLNEGGYAVVTHYLATRPLEYALDPARGLQRAPETTSTRRAVTESLGVIEQEIVDAIETEVVGFRHGIVSSLAMRSLFERMRKIMLAVGYVTHPALEANKGRPNNPMRDGTRPTLYFQKGSDFLAIEDPNDLLVAVEDAMSAAPPSGANVVPIGTRRGAPPPAGVRG